MDLTKAKKVLAKCYLYRLARDLYHSVADIPKDLSARRVLAEAKGRTTASHTIRVGFVVQMANIWDKQVSVFEYMDQSEKFETFMFVVPPYDFVTDELSDYGDNYFVNNYPQAIKTVLPDGSILGLSKFDLDYVFLQRPYDKYLPEKLRSYELYKYTKVCYIPYGFDMSKEYLPTSTDKAFFRYVYFAFLSNDEIKRVLTKKFPYNVKHGLQRFECLGYPEFDKYYLLKKPESDDFTLLWTPRWNYDPVKGGSHFFEYKDKIIDLARKYPAMKIVIRPHPLMFEEFEKKGLFTRGEIDDYKKELANNGIELSEGNSGYNDLLRADILLSDFSSIMAPYFMTGKPIIYCTSLEVTTYKESQLIFDNVYSIDDWDSAHHMIDELYSGHDEKESARLKAIGKLSNGNATKDLVDVIISDFTGQ